MSIDQEILLYSITNTFESVLNTEISNDSKKYVKKMGKKMKELDITQRMYYTKYSLCVAQSLMEYLKNVSLFEINTDAENDIQHDFRLHWGKNNIAHISLYHTTIPINGIIPDKLMKVCKYKKNTKISKQYTARYQSISEKGYNKIKSKSKYSELNDKTKNSAIIDPVCNLFIETLSKKRKCANNLYSHLFNEADRIVFKIYKNRFIMYDFGIELPNVESFRMKSKSNDTIIITFNNKTKFSLVLKTNASQIKEHISLKFHTSFVNMDEIFAVSSITV